MVSKDTARDDGANASSDDEEYGDDDLATEGTDEGKTTGTGSKKAPSQGDKKKKDDSTDDDEGDEEEEKSAKKLLALREEELSQLKKSNRTLTKKMNDLLAKVGVKEGEDPEDIAAQLRKANERAEALLRENRRAQKVEAVRDVLSTDKYRDYAQNARYIIPMLDLDDEVDVDQDGRYDADELKRAAREAVKQYADDNPRPPSKREGAGGPGGEAGRKGALPPSEEEELARLEKMFKVSLR